MSARPWAPPSRARNHRRSAALVALIVVAITALAACDNSATPATATSTPRSSTGTAPGSSTSVTTSSSTTTTAAPITGTDEDQIRATIDTYWAEWLLAGDPPDPDRAAFLAVLTGEQRQREVDELQKMQALGQARRLPPASVFSHTTLSVDVTAERAIAVECVIDDSWLVDVDTGRVRNDEIGTSVFTTELVREGGQWKLTVSNTTKDQLGVQPCVA